MNVGQIINRFQSFHYLLLPQTMLLLSRAFWVKSDGNDTISGLFGVEFMFDNECKVFDSDVFMLEEI